jgi:membrane protease YdiL (CAAX protease family)
MDLRQLVGLFLILSGMLLAMGDFLGLLTPELDLFEKTLAYLMLVILWYELDLPKNVFGREDWRLNKFILLAFYVIAFKHVITLERSTDLIQISGSWRATLLFDSLMFGQVILNLVCMYIAITFTFDRPGVLYSVVHIILTALANVRSVEVDKVWERFARSPLDQHLDGKEASAVIVLARYLLSYYILLAFFLIIFDPITQWMITSVDKALFLISTLYFLHFSEQISASGFANQIDDMERSFILTIAKLFTTPHLFHLGLSVILLSRGFADAGYFLIPYVLGSELDPFYMDVLCEPSGRGLGPAQELMYKDVCLEHHVPLKDLLQSEMIRYQGAELWFTVFLYAIGVISLFLLLLLPMGIWLLMMLDVKGEQLTRLKSYAPLMGVACALVLTFLFNPWITLRRINPQTGIIGVDMRTQLITDAPSIAGMAIPLDVTSLLILTMVLILGFHALARHEERRWIVYFLLFSVSMLYIANYTVLYGFSEIESHVGNVVNTLNPRWAPSLKPITRVMLTKFFADLLVVSAAFYLGALPLFLYGAGQWVSKNFIGGGEDRFVLVWIAMGIAGYTAILRLAAPGLSQFMLLIAFLYVLSFWSLGSRCVFTERLAPAMEGFAVFLILLLLHILVSVLTGELFGISAHIGTLLANLVVIQASLPYVLIAGREGYLERPALLFIIGALVLGLAWGYVGEELREPTLPLPRGTNLVVWVVLTAIFTAIAEELWFRGVLLRSLAKAFPFELACGIQALLFATAHFGRAISPMVFLTLALFGYIAGMLVQRSRSLSVPIVFHFAANFALLGLRHGLIA